MPYMDKPIYFHRQQFFLDWLKRKGLEWPENDPIEQQNIMIEYWQDFWAGKNMEEVS